MRKILTRPSRLATLRADDQPTTPPVDGPTANEADVDRALFGPYEDGEQR